MNIAWVIPCRYVEVHDNLATMVGAGIDTFWLPQEPRGVAVMFAVRITAMTDELGPDKQHTMVQRIRSPDDEVIHEMQAEWSAAAQGEVRHPEWLQGVSLATAAQFGAPVEGTYTVSHEVNGAEHPVPLHVVHDFPPGFQPPEQ
jgi:hypothetical protein